MEGSRPACGPFIRPDDAGTESASIVRTFLWLKTTAANPQLLADQVSQLLVQPSKPPASYSPAARASSTPPGFSVSPS